MAALHAVPARRPDPRRTRRSHSRRHPGPRRQPARRPSRPPRPLRPPSPDRHNHHPRRLPHRHRPLHLPHPHPRTSPRSIRSSRPTGTATTNVRCQDWLAQTATVTNAAHRRWLVPGPDQQFWDASQSSVSPARRQREASRRPGGLGRLFGNRDVANRGHLRHPQAIAAGPAQLLLSHREPLGGLSHKWCNWFCSSE
jgi:hypothetical protein